ncbi:MAG: hypothetical protein II933_04200 [Candidatus Methanomethylophilaceae archaeon]|nr:hypothetical protein [Candidatus Methanomethylophilaceae archaeon]
MNKNAMIAVAVAAVAIVAIAAAFVLTSGDKGESYDTETVTVNAYNMSYIVTDQNDPRYPEPVKDVSEYLMGEYTFLVKKGQGEVLYTTLDDFARLFDDDLNAGYCSTVDRDGKKFTWTFTNDNGGEAYRYVFDAGEMTMSETGDGDVLVTDDYRSSVIDQLKLDVVTVVDTGLPNTYSFAGCGLDPIVKGGKTYFPLGFLDSSTQLELSRSFIYSEEDCMLFKYGSSAQMDAPFICGSDDEATINKIVTASYARYSDPDGTIYPPVYMLEFTRDLFYFLMDNFYDLNEVTGYRCMSDFFKNNAYSDGLVSQDPAVRGEAYTVLIGLLNDLHSGYGGSVVLGEMPAYNPGKEVQNLLNDRSTLYLQLMQQRAAAVKAYGADSPTDVRYSSDGTTAYFSFDEFSAVTHYDDQPLTPEQRMKDTYFFFVDKLNEIKAHGGVERVVIDDSCNGGGIVVTMGKLLALMSKDNRAVSYERNGITGSIREYIYRVDSNGDGLYDERDCFGNDFRFYIHTSLYSYSSGNAFPFLAKAYGIAETIGTKSGGGECTAVYNILPFGHQINHSSFEHLGYYDEATQTYHGDEHGQSADIFLGVHQFDVDKVSIVLKDHEAQESSRSKPLSRPEAQGPTAGTKPFRAVFLPIFSSLSLRPFGGSSIVIAAITRIMPMTSVIPNSSPNATTPHIVETIRLDVIMMDTVAGSTRRML